MIRHPAVAGQFYPSNPLELRSQVNNFIKTASLETTPAKAIRAIICPHAGYIYSGPIAAIGYKALQGLTPKEIIILGPTHHFQFKGIAMTDYASWETPLGVVNLSNLCQKLSEASSFVYMNEAHELEHSIEVQIPFLQSTFKNFKLTPLATGNQVNHKKVAEVLSKNIPTDALIIVSSDLSHYLYYDDAEKTDKHTIDEILKLESDIDHEEACGADGIKILIELAKIENWIPMLLGYKNSGDISGMKDEVVGYAAIAFFDK